MELGLLAFLQLPANQMLCYVTVPDAMCCHVMQAPSQRPTASVSLSHADPVVQPTQSSAGAVGRSAVPSSN